MTDLLRDLARAKAVFQLRAIAAVICAKPLPIDAEAKSAKTRPDRRADAITDRG